MRRSFIEAVAGNHPHNGTGPNVVASYQMTPTTDRPFHVTGERVTDRVRTVVTISLTRDEALKLAADILSFDGRKP